MNIANRSRSYRHFEELGVSKNELQSELICCIFSRSFNKIESLCVCGACHFSDDLHVVPVPPPLVSEVSVGKHTMLLRHQFPPN